MTILYTYGITMAMQKFMVSMPDRQKSFLDREADRLGISVAELLRRIVDTYREPDGIAVAGLLREPAPTDAP